MATMLTVTRMIVQIRRSVVGDDGIYGLERFSGEIFRFTSQRLAVPEQTCVRKGKEPVLDTDSSYLLLFFAAWNLLYVDGWETKLHASSHCSVSQRVKCVPFTRSSSPERAQCNSSQRFSTRSEQQLSLGRIAIGSAPQLYFNCVLPVHRDESGTQLIVGEYPILNTRH